MVLDTGSQPVVLEDDTARDFGVTGASAASLVGVSGVEGARQGAISSLRLGGREFSSIPCVIRTRRTRIGGDALFGSKRIPLDLIGMNFLRAHFDWVTLDLRHGFVELGSGGAFQPRRSAGLWQVPLIFQGGLPFVRVGSGGRSWLALVDTAAAAAAEVDRSTAAALGLAPVSGQTRPRGGIGGPRGGQASVPVVILPELAGLGPELTGVEALLVNDTPKIGTGLLRHFRVTLDLRSSALWLQR
jgi:predicted aspartyl protease